MLSLLGFVILFVSLGRAGLQGRAEDFLLVPYGDPNRVTIPFQRLESPAGLHHHAIFMESDAADRLLNSPEIGLLMVCDWTPAEVVSAEIVLSEKSSGKVTGRFAAKKGAVIRENRLLEFERGPVAAGPVPGKQSVAVHVVSRGSPNLAVIGQFSEGIPKSAFLWMPTTSLQGKAGVASVCGVYESGRKGGACSKAGLLACTWGGGTGGAWIVHGLVAAAAVVWLLGLIALTRAVPGADTALQGVWAAVGSSLLFFSIGLVFLILVPPFQTPDEPDHFLAYSALNGRPGLASDALRLANAAHFERLKFRTDEKYSALDIGEPMQGGWAAHIEATDTRRSPLARRIWSLLSPLFQTDQPGAMLLGLRFANVLFVTLCLLASLTVAARALQPGGGSVFMAAPAILTPCISFFSVGLSNYPFLIGGYLIQAVALAVQWAQSAETEKKPGVQAAAGGLCGTGIALAVGAGDNGVFCMSFWALLIPLYWYARGARAAERPAEIGCWRAFVFAFIGAMTVCWFLTGLSASDFDIIPILLPSFLKAVLSGVGLPWLGVKTLMGIGFVTAVTVFSFVMLRAGFLAGRSGVARFAKPAVGVFGVGLILFVVFAASSRIPEDHAAGIFAYVLKVLYSFFEGFGPGKSDWLVSQSFWGVFGWLDTPLPEVLIGAIKYTASAGLVILFYLSLKSNGYPEGAGFLAANIVALSAFVVCVAAGYYSALNGITGRYLIGAYLLILTLAYEGFRRLFERIEWPQIGPAPVNAGVCLACMVIQCTAWLAVAHRYF